MKIYTDGAFRPTTQVGGWAWVWAPEDPRVWTSVFAGRVDEAGSSNRMELTAVLQALDTLQEAGAAGTRVQVVSDSAYVVNGSVHVHRWRRQQWLTSRGDAVKNQDLWARFLEAHSKLRSRGTPLTLTWVKGHAGDPYNEACDRAATRMTL